MMQLQDVSASFVEMQKNEERNQRMERSADEVLQEPEATEDE